MATSVVVTGATGRQGGCVMRSLMDHPFFTPETTRIYAVTRQQEGYHIKLYMDENPPVQFVKGDFKNAVEIFRTLTVPPKAIFVICPGGKDEVQHCKDVIDAAIASGIVKIVLSSADRGAAQGGNTLCGVPNLDAKHEIEAHLIKVVRASNDVLSYTIIRPATLMTDFVGGFNAKTNVTIWRDYLGLHPLKLVDPSDIGAFAAAAIMAPRDPAFKNIELNIAGDELIFDHANQIYTLKTGQALPAANKFVTSMALSLNKDRRLLAEHLKKNGSGAVPGAALERASTNAPITSTTFAAWIDKSLAWKAK